MIPPAGVAQNDIRRTVGPVFVGGVKKAAQIGLQSQHIEVIAAGFNKECLRRVLAGVQAGLRDVVGGKRIEAAIAIA